MLSGGQQSPVITIDGPSGTGKGTVSSLLATELGYFFLDSGMLYRALAWAVLEQRIDIVNDHALQQCIDDVNIGLSDQEIYCNNVDVSNAIRQEAVGLMASKISANPLVRKRLLRLQRDQRRLPGLVTDGRDMGTVVFPDARLKIFLTASPEERAKRRFNQLKKKGIDVSLRQVREELDIRDRQDRDREQSPLKPADDAIIIDTTLMSVQAVLQEILTLVRARCMVK